MGSRKLFRKNVLRAGVVLFGLTSIALWLLGVRIGHIVFLVRALSPPPVLSTDETAELHDWLRDDAVHLRTVAAESGFDDLQPLKAMIGEARVVALGEEAHMNRDFYRVKHRLVEFLVSEMEFTVFAIETPFAAAMELNDYLLTGRGTPEQALASLVYGAWHVEAVFDMIKWMRRYNVTHDKQLRFYGFDNKPAIRSARVVQDYLNVTDSTEEYDQLLSSLAELCTIPRSWGEPNEALSNAVEPIKSLISHLENHRPASAQSPSARDVAEEQQWQVALQNARVLLQNVEFHVAPSISEASDRRDNHMANNVRWIAHHEQGEKIILWAANAHILATPGSGCMGAHLRHTYGDDMFNIALLSYQKSHGSEGEKAAQYAYVAPGDSVQAVLATAGLDKAVINLRSLPEGAASRYFNAPRSTGKVKMLLPWAYDAILFLESTTNARPIIPPTPEAPGTGPATSNRSENG